MSNSEVHILLWLTLGFLIGGNIGWLAGRAHELEKSLKRELKP